MYFRSFLFSVCFFLFSSCSALIPIPEQDVIFPSYLRDAQLYVSSLEGFFINAYGMCLHVDREMVDPAVRDMTAGEIFIKIGHIWRVDFEGRTFLVSRTTKGKAAEILNLGFPVVPANINQAIERSMPQPMALLVYNTGGISNKLGIKMVPMINTTVD